MPLLSAVGISGLQAGEDVKPLVLDALLNDGYRAMAADAAR